MGFFFFGRARQQRRLLAIIEDGVIEGAWPS